MTLRTKTAHLQKVLRRSELTSTLDFHSQTCTEIPNPKQKVSRWRCPPSKPRTLAAPAGVGVGAWTGGTHPGPRRAPRGLLVLSRERQSFISGRTRQARWVSREPLSERRPPASCGDFPPHFQTLCTVCVYDSLPHRKYKSRLRNHGNGVPPSALLFFVRAARVVK